MDFLISFILSFSIFFTPFVVIILKKVRIVNTTSAENSSETENSENQTDDELYFRDNVLVTDEFKIEITDYRVIPAGETGNEYGDTPVVAFWYDTTNTSGADIDPSTAWIYSFTAIQDNDPNAINELNMGMLPDDSFRDSQIETIKKDGTVSNAVSYELDDDFTPVTLVATNGLFGDELGQQEYSIN